MMGERLIRPTVSLVKAYSDKFSAGDAGTADVGLRKLVDTFPGNVELSDVLLKVAAINAIYATNIYAIFAVAQHIWNLQIDARLGEGDLTLVHDIAAIHIAGKQRFNYSFASKYCAWHVPGTYAIYDSYIDWLLWRYQLKESFYQGGFKRSDLRNYPTFVSIILAFKEYFGLGGVPVREIDHFLWLYGQGVKPDVDNADRAAPLSRDA